MLALESFNKLWKFTARFNTFLCLQPGSWYKLYFTESVLNTYNVSVRRYFCRVLNIYRGQLHQASRWIFVQKNNLSSCHQHFDPESYYYNNNNKYSKLRLELTNCYPEYKVNQYNIIMDVLVWTRQNLKPSKNLSSFHVCTLRHICFEGKWYSVLLGQIS